MHRDWSCQYRAYMGAAPGPSWIDYIFQFSFFVCLFSLISVFSFSFLVFVFVFCFCFSRQGFSVSPWLSWNSLCRSGWPRTQKSTCLCLPSTGIIKGVRHHARLLNDLFQKSLFAMHEEPSGLLRSWSELCLNVYISKPMPGLFQSYQQHRYNFWHDESMGWLQLRLINTQKL
jgi:hypothetical protein